MLAFCICPFKAWFHFTKNDLCFFESINNFHAIGILKNFSVIFWHFVGAKFQNGLPEIIKPLNKLQELCKHWKYCVIRSKLQNFKIMETRTVPRKMIKYHFSRGKNPCQGSTIVLWNNGGDEGSRTPVQNGSKQASTNVVFISLAKIKEKTNLYNPSKVFFSVTHLDSYLDMSTIINILHLAWVVP